jgi:GntR family transcriptional regulator
VTSSFEPRYRVIERELRERIAGLTTHAPLPSEAELCAEFGVSRMTARGAVTRLAAEGLVYREPGRGTFVAPPASHRRADNLVRFSEQMRRRGRTPTSRLLAARTRPATAGETQQLHTGTVVEIRRVRLADGIPVACETAVFGATLAALLDLDLATASLHAALTGLGRVPTGGHATITAVTATAQDAELLAVPPASALLVERRLIVDQHGRPLERTETRYAGDRYALDVVFDVDPGTRGESQ